MLVFTQGFTCRPRSTAFLARSPAPIMTLGLLVLVQEVMAAMTTSPCLSWKRSSWCSTSAREPSSSGFSAKPWGPTGAVSMAFHLGWSSVSSMRSWGRLGPARLGRTVRMSSSRVSVNSGSGVSSVRKSPCSLV